MHFPLANDEKIGFRLHHLAKQGSENLKMSFRSLECVILSHVYYILYLYFPSFTRSWSNLITMAKKIYLFMSILSNIDATFLIPYSVS
jgi:hypothetical protein